MAFQLDTQLASLSVTLFMQTMNSILVSAFTLWGGISYLATASYKYQQNGSLS